MSDPNDTRLDPWVEEQIGKVLKDACQYAEDERSLMGFIEAYKVPLEKLPDAALIAALTGLLIYKTREEDVSAVQKAVLNLAFARALIGYGMAVARMGLGDTDND